MAGMVDGVYCRRAPVSRRGTVARASYTAEFEVTGSILWIKSSLGMKSAQLGRLPPEVLAGLLLRELIMDEQRRSGRSD